MVSKVYMLRRKSKSLLDVAKQAVEMAIEQSEEEAMTWLNKIISESQLPAAEVTGL